MTSGYIPPKGEPDPDEILAALREVISDKPRLAEMPEEKVARQLVLEGEPRRRLWWRRRGHKMSGAESTYDLMDSSKGEPLAQSVLPAS